MKRSLITILFVCLAFHLHGQGTIFVFNFQNTGVFNGSGGTPFVGGTNGDPVFSSGVTSNGLVFTLDPSAQAGHLGYHAGSQMMGLDFSFQLYGGPTPTQATTLFYSLTGSAIAGDNANWGQFTGTNRALNVPGTTASTTVYLDLKMWEGSTFNTYNAALLGGDYTADSGAFANPSGGGANQPQTLIGMPDMLLQVPEPSFFGLSVLGAMGVFWRRLYGQAPIGTKTGNDKEHSL